MSDKSESFWDNLRKEIKSIGTDTRASDMRRFKAYMIDRVFAMEQGTKIRESLLSSQAEKLQALEEKVTECAANYWKEVENRKAAEEENKILRERLKVIADDSCWPSSPEEYAAEALEKIASNEAGKE